MMTEDMKKKTDECLNWTLPAMSPEVAISMLASSNGNIFHITGPLCGEFTGDQWIPLTKASDAELWCFLWSAPGQMAE